MLRIVSAFFGTYILLLFTAQQKRPCFHRIKPLKTRSFVYCTNTLRCGTGDQPPTENPHNFVYFQRTDTEIRPYKTGEFTVNLRNKINSEFRIPNS